jgi:hypothetical protein
MSYMQLLLRIYVFMLAVLYKGNMHGLLWGEKLLAWEQERQGATLQTQHSTTGKMGVLPATYNIQHAFDCNLTSFLIHRTGN